MPSACVTYAYRTWLHRIGPYSSVPSPIRAGTSLVLIVSIACRHNSVHGLAGQRRACAWPSGALPCVAWQGTGTHGWRVVRVIVLMLALIGGSVLHIPILMSIGYVYIYTFTHVYAHVYAHACTHVCTQAQPSVQTHVHAPGCTHVHTHIYIQVLRLLQRWAIAPQPRDR